MSQSLPPYSPYSLPSGPQTYGGFSSGWPDLLAPARRAALALFILAAVFVIFGVCAGIFSAIDLSKLPPEAQSQFHAAEAKQLPGAPPLQVMARYFAGGCVVVALLLAVVGAFIRTGRRGAVIPGMVLVGLAILYFGWAIIAAPATAQNTPGIVLGIAILGVLALILRWLILALRNASLLQNAQAQYQMQFQQYQQQATSAWPPAGPSVGTDGYGYGGYGSMYPPPPQSPGNPAAPPTQEPTDQSGQSTNPQ